VKNNMLGLAQHCLVEPGLPYQGYKNIGIMGQPGKIPAQNVIAPTIAALTL
jgi:hypothetical protein